MKKTSILLLSLLFCIFLSKAQTVQLNQGFTSPFNPSANGWLIQNNSSPLGSTSWQQGLGFNFPANSGAQDDYFYANFNCQGSTSGSISCFLITPTVTLLNGGVFQFVTRTLINPANFPDRLEVLMSIGTGTGAIANTAAAVGTFTTTLITINPSLTTTGYPAVWTVYSVAISGVPVATPGRFAFRYNVPNGGVNGSNSDLIGLDDVMYTYITCPSVSVSPNSSTICAGNSVNLVGSGATTYSWNTGAQTNNLNVIPSATSVYTLTGITPNCPNTIATATVNVVGLPVVAVNNFSACSGTNATLTATGASSYSWSNGSTGASIVVGPVTQNTVYTVTGSNGPGCSNTATANVTVVLQPNISAPSATICIGSSATLTASGANTYVWNTGSTSSSIVVSPANNAVYTVTGSIGAGCVGSTTTSVSLESLPVISIANVTACPGVGTPITASGASTYTWSTGGTGATIVVTQTSNAVYTVTGSSTFGCTNTQNTSVPVGQSFLVISNMNPVVCPNQPFILGAGGALSYTWSTGANSASIVITPTQSATYVVNGFDGICNELKYIPVTVSPLLFAPNFTTCAGTSATLIASGASSYNWSTGSTTSLTIVSPTTNTSYTVTGTSGSCSDTKVVSVTISNKLSVNCTQVCLGGNAVLLSAYGASSYTWLPINDFNATVLFTPTAVTVFTLVGSTGTCTGSQSIPVVICVGTEELSMKDEQILVYPNPFQDQLTVKDAEGHLRLVNMLGQVLFEEEVKGTSVINTSDLKPGVYFINVTNEEKMTRKVIRVVKD